MKDEKVINLKAVKALKNPIVAICQQLENHQQILDFEKKATNMLFNSSVKNKEQIKNLINATQVLIWSNIVAWLTIAGIVFALFNHSHNLGSLL